jgi:hypothetical protein
MQRLGHTFIFFGLCLVANGFAAQSRGLAESGQAKNLALLVGAPHGLPGIDLDINNVNAIVTDSAYQFKVTKLWESQGTASKVGGGLTTLSSQVGEHGTFYFYFSGHGNVGNVWVQDRLMNIKEIRSALENGRLTNGPMDRLVMMFDSCNSGSLVDPLRQNLMPLVNEELSQQMADQIASVFSQREDANYWNQLFVFVSSRANETSNAGPLGSEFTVALRKGFDEVMANNGTIGEWVQKTKAYTNGHHPVERLVPYDLTNEKLAL